MIGPSQQCVYKGAGNFPPAISRFFKYEEAVITLLCSSSDSGCTDGALLSINQQLHRGPLQKTGWNIQRTKHFLCSLEYCNCSRYGPSRCKRWHSNADSKGKLWNQQCITLKLAPTTCIIHLPTRNKKEQHERIVICYHVGCKKLRADLQGTVLPIYFQELPCLLLPLHSAYTYSWHSNTIGLAEWSYWH